MSKLTATTNFSCRDSVRQRQQRRWKQVKLVWNFCIFLIHQSWLIIIIFAAHVKEKKRKKKSYKVSLCWLDSNISLQILCKHINIAYSHLMCLFQHIWTYFADLHRLLCITHLQTYRMCQKVLISLILSSPLTWLCPSHLLSSRVSAPAELHHQLVLESLPAPCCVPDLTDN